MSNDVKDRYNVPDGAYHEMAKVCREMSRHYQIKRQLKELNEQWSMGPTHEGTVGVQQLLEEHLCVRVRHLLQTSGDNAPFLQDKKLHVKLLGDGTNICKRLHVVSFMFTLLNEVETTASFEGTVKFLIIRTLYLFVHYPFPRKIVNLRSLINSYTQK